MVAWIFVGDLHLWSWVGIPLDVPTNIQGLTNSASEA